MSDARGPSVAEIDKSRQNYSKSIQESAIQGLPPGFIAGLRVRFNPDTSVTVGPGTASVANVKVEIDEDTNLTTRMETFTRGNPTWAYIYLGRDGLFHVDTIVPGFYARYSANYHTRQPWRFIGRMWIDSTGVTRFAGTGGFN